MRTNRLLARSYRPQKRWIINTKVLWGGMGGMGGGYAIYMKPYWKPWLRSRAFGALQSAFHPGQSNRLQERRSYLSCREAISSGCRPNGKTPGIQVARLRVQKIEDSLVGRPLPIDPRSTHEIITCIDTVQYSCDSCFSNIFRLRRKKKDKVR